RWLRQRGVPDPLLAVVGAVDRKRPAASGGQTVLQEPRRLCHGGGSRRPRARELRVRRCTRGKDSRRARRLRRDGGFVPPPPRPRASHDVKAIIGCIRNAIADAELTPDDIDYINPHGTGTPENDKMEYLGVSSVFGERARSIPISSNKSMIGHTLSAAGAVET